jgi:hypothetical protein
MLYKEFDKLMIGVVDLLQSTIGHSKTKDSDSYRIRLKILQAKHLYVFYIAKKGQV